MNRRLAQTLILGSIFSLLIAAIAVAWYTRERQVGIYSDDATIYEQAARVSPRNILWQPAEILAELADAGTDVFEPMVSADGLSLFFVKGKPGENTDIYMATRTTEGWSKAEPLAAINTEADELGPEMSADATRLFFYSDREGGAGGYDLWMTERDADGVWRDAVNLGAHVNSGYNEYGMTISRDGEKIYFSSNRPQPDETQQINDDAWPATLREERYSRDYDLYVTRLTDRGWSDPKPVHELNSVFNDGSPALSPFGDFLYMSSDRPGGQGGYDIYRVRLHPEKFGLIETIDEAVNTPAHELDATLAMGGYQLLFSSNRPASVRTADDSKRFYQIYQSTSREVYMQYRTTRAAIDWSKILPWLFWIVFTLMVLALLWLLHRLMKSERYGKLSLLARCLLVSGIVHALIVLLLGAWGVGNSLMDWAGRSRGTQVVITTPKMGDSLARQVRGDLTSFNVNGAFEVEASEQTPMEQIDPSMIAMSVDRSNLTLERAELSETPDAPADQPEVELARTSAAQTPSLADQPDVMTPQEAARRASSEAVVRIDTLPTDVNRADHPVTPQQAAQDAMLDVQPSSAQDQQQLADMQSLSDSNATMAVALPTFDSQVALPKSGADDLISVDLPSQQTPHAAQESTLVVDSAERTVEQADAPASDGAAGSDQSFNVELPAETPAIEDARRFALESEQARDAVVPDTALPDRVDTVAIGAPDESAEIDLPSAAAASARRTDELRVESVTDRLADESPVEQISTDDGNVSAAARIDIAASRIEPAQNVRPVEAAIDSAAPDVSIAADSDIALPALDDTTFPEMAMPTEAASRTSAEPDETSADQRSHLSLARETLPDDPKDGDGSSDTITDVPDVDLAKDRLNVALPEAEAGNVLAMPDVPLEDIALPSFETQEDALTLPTESSSTRPAQSEGTTRAEELSASGAMDAVQAETQLSETPDDSMMNLVQTDIERAEESPAWSSPDLLMHDALLRAETDPLRDTSMVIVLDQSDAGLRDLKLPTETQVPFDPSAAAAGVLFGLVTDAMTGELIVGASVYLDLSSKPTTNAMTDDKGRYSMIFTSELPDFVAVSASSEGYIPGTANVAAEAVEGSMLRLDFELVPADAAVIILEADPEVHHLGDDSFSGRINSQFQKESEGLQYDGLFRMTRQQLNSAEDTVEFHVFARGTQRDNPVRINGRQLDGVLNNSPNDGSFGEYRIRFPKRWLRVGRNRVQINSVGRSDDPDDFEFVNIRIFLAPDAVIRAEQGRKRSRDRVDQQ